MPRACSVVVVPVDSKHGASDAALQMDDDDRPRPRGDAASRLAGESLDSYSQEELGLRIEALEAEIARVIAHRNKSAAHRVAADALFKKSP